MPSVNSEIDKQLLLMFSNKDKHRYLSEGYKKSLSEIKSLGFSEKITLDDLVSSKARILEPELHNLLQKTPDAFDATPQELVFRTFITCCNELSSEVAAIEKTINDAPTVSLKLIERTIGNAEESINIPLDELNQVIRKYADKEYVDQEITINFDTLESILSRIKLELTDRFEKNFPVHSTKIIHIGADSSMQTENFDDTRRINLDGFLNLISGIKQYSQKQLQDLQTTKEVKALHSCVNTFSDVSVLRSIKTRDVFYEALQGFTEGTDVQFQEDTRFLKAQNGYKQEFFEDLGARLYHEGFIDGESTNLQFAQLFIGKPVKKKINWVGSRAKAPMLYFMYLLFEKHKIVEYPSQPFPRIVNSFLLDNETIERDTNAHDVLRSSYKKIARGKYPGKDTKTKIEKVVESTLEAYK